MSERERWWKDTISEVTIDVGRKDGRTDVGVAGWELVFKIKSAPSMRVIYGAWLKEL